MNKHELASVGEASRVPVPRTATAASADEAGRRFQERWAFLAWLSSQFFSMACGMRGSEWGPERGFV